MTARVLVEDLGVRFELDRQRRPMTPAVRHVRRHTSRLWALEGLTCRIEEGMAVGLIGANGCGKTTLLRVIAGVLEPDQGEVIVRGRVASLLSTGAGLMSRLTGRENAVLLGVLAGLPKRTIRALLPQVAHRSELNGAFERPVSTYSQGMRARLGFAVIEQTDPDILLLDEVHEAMDGDHRARLEEFARTLCRRGGVLVAAGHDHHQLTRLCDHTLALDDPVPHVARARGWESRSQLPLGTE